MRFDRPLLSFPEWDTPLVSILVPAGQETGQLYECLASVQVYSDLPYDIHLLIENPDDVTACVVQNLSNVTTLRHRNPESGGGLNQAVSAARGRYLLFLSPDILPSRGYLSGLVGTMKKHPDCGIVGVKIIAWHGELEEAGAVLCEDGSIRQYGRGDNPFRGQYNFLRTVDLCSMGCLLVRRDLLEEATGFNETLTGPLYLAADLSLRLAQLGYKTLLQPEVVVFRQARTPHPVDAEDGPSPLAREALPRMWSAELARRSSHRDRGRGTLEGIRVLFIDDRVPVPHLGSGYGRSRKLLELLADLGFVVTFLPAHLRDQPMPTTRELQQGGIEVAADENIGMVQHLRDRSGCFDIVIVSRPHNAAVALPLLRRLQPDSRIIYDAEAIFSRREIQRADVEGRAFDREVREQMIDDELALMRGADLVMVTTEVERQLVARKQGHDSVHVWGHVVECSTPSTGFSDRRDLLFLGGFLGDKSPNVDAILYFCSDLFPRIRNALPDVRLIIVGRSPPAPIRELGLRARVVVKGQVDDLKSILDRCRVCVVPQRFGAGISIKCLDAMAHGLPVVASESAAEGLGLRSRQSALVAADDIEFVADVVRLYSDEQLWHTIQRNALEYVREDFSKQPMMEKLAHIMALALVTHSEGGDVG